MTLPKLPASTLRTLADFVTETAPELLAIWVQEPLLSTLALVCEHAAVSDCADPTHDHCYGCGIAMPHALDSARSDPFELDFLFDELDEAEPEN